MKCRLIFLIILQTTIFCSVTAQINDDFSDGNFKKNPTWSGDNSKFIVNTEGQLQLSAPAEAGQSYLSTASEISNNAEWTFYIKMGFNPSSNNYMDIYLMSDTADLSGSVNGYFVRIGNIQDDVCLYKQSGDKKSMVKIIDGTDDRVDVSTVELNIKVSKSHENEWELFVDTDLSQNFISEGKAVEGEFLISRYFGLYCNYSSTRSDKFFFDDLSISGEVFTDNEAPKVDSVVVLSDSTIHIFFNEKMKTSSISNIDNYFGSNGVGNPQQADSYQDSSVILSFIEKFNDAIENQISFHGAEDFFGNSLDNVVVNFTYNAPYIIGFGDIIISEIMADPTQGVDLPEYEYLEIHNPHAEPFYLDQIRMIVGQDTSYIPELTIEPFEYIIFCQHAAVEHFESFDRTIKITKWPSLNNRGERITLLNQLGEFVYSVSYADSWYKSIDKDDGGYSLEMIDVNFHCWGEENWVASVHPAGGTPGIENSVKDELKDLSDPEIDKIIATSNSSVSIYLSENIGPQEILENEISISPDLEISKIQLLQPDFSEIQIWLNTAINAKTKYELTIRNLVDCAGNMQKETTSTFILPEKADSLDLVINEILFNPWSGGVDFVEIYNQSEKYIDLNSVTIGNKEPILITSEHSIIEPMQHIAITSDPSILNNQYPGIEEENTLKSIEIPAFNDDEGNVILADADGKQIDYFHYDEDYHSDFLNDVEGVS